MPPWQLLGSLVGQSINRATAAADGVDFYTVSHNIIPVKEFFAKWYKKVKNRL
jgi:hypothetical protein